MGLLFKRIRAALLGYYLQGYFRFIATNVVRIIFFYGLIVIAVILIAKYVLNLNQIFQNIINGFSSDVQALTLFFISESILGLIPPDLFMLWAEKFEEPIYMLTFLGILSYLGGIVAYGIGLWISKREKIKNYIERRLNKYIVLTQKWGGAFLVISALFPFSPYAMVVLAVSMFKYPFPKLLLFGIARIIRFVVQGTALIKLFQMNS